MEGYIKLYRKFSDWEWYDDIPTKVIFIHCLLKANFKEYKYRGKDYPKGSFISGRIELSKQTCLSERQVRTALTKLKTTNELTIISNSSFSVIQLNNWDKYQMESTSTKPNERPAIDQQSTTGEEGNNGRKKERKDTYTENFEIFWKEYPNRVGKPDALKKYKEKEHYGIMEGLIKWKEFWEYSETEPRFIPHPATWLNQERYNDDPPETKPKTLSFTIKS